MLRKKVTQQSRKFIVCGKITMKFAIYMQDTDIGVQKLDFRYGMKWCRTVQGLVQKSEAPK
jgi:hypothetical protein